MAKHATKADLDDQAENVERALRALARAEAAVDRAPARERNRALEALDKAIKRAESEVNVYRFIEMFYKIRQRERRRVGRRATKGRHKR